jgi:hypothetical protein
METPKNDPDTAGDVDGAEFLPDSYETDSGVIADIDDVEVDVVPSGKGTIISSQADPEAYGIDVSDDIDIPTLPENET